MAVIWTRHANGVRYEVRTAGRTRRLYTDGVLHSQYNARVPLTGGVWDLLLLPAFFDRERPPGRVLVLGLGGGAVVRLLQHFMSPREIIALDIDPLHIHVARRYFGVGGRGVRLVEADAVRWLADWDGPRFDLIIDDLFGGSDGDPRRAVAADSAWFRRVGSCLARDGVLVANFPTPAELASCGYFTNARVRNGYSAAFRFTTPHHWNAVGAFLRRPASSAALRANLARVPALDSRRKACRLRFRVQRV